MTSKYADKETNKHVKRMSHLANEPSSHQLAGFVATGAVPTAGFGPVVPDELPKPKINQHTQILISIINRGPSPGTVRTTRAGGSSSGVFSCGGPGGLIGRSNGYIWRTGKVWPPCAS